MKKNLLHIKKTASLALVLLGAAGIAFGVHAATTFTQPTGTPPNANTSTPINVGGDNQVKEGNISADTLTGRTTVRATNNLCIGNDCRGSWPEGESDFSSTCSIDTLLVYNTATNPRLPHGPGGEPDRNELAQNCAGTLSQSEIDDGYILVSFDRCPGVAGRDCAGVGYCQFARFSCDSGVSFEAGDFNIVNAYEPPPECNNGIDDDGDGFIDMADIGCSSESDPSEVNEPGVIIR